MNHDQTDSILFTPLDLPNGVRLKNRLIKSAMSDSLGDGRGDPTPTQIRLYERWAQGGVAASIIGEVQGDPRFPEKPGNLLLMVPLMLRPSGSLPPAVSRKVVSYGSNWVTRVP